MLLIGAIQFDPSGENANELTLIQFGPWRVAIRVPVSTSHISIRPLASPEASVVPSGENATECALSSVGSSAMRREGSTSYNHTPMFPTRAKYRPFGEKASDRSLSLTGPLPKRAIAPSGKCQVLMSPSITGGTGDGDC